MCVSVCNRVLQKQEDRVRPDMVTGIFVTSAPVQTVALRKAILGYIVSSRQA